ncbi:hypothetical protein [Gemmatimonas groenlandica]|uniref:Bacterial surface antigen (D15) domain-containing protein n=1 Tax=Gemmatimonas groenlandica TaxID=2732249 RepID=A0A6M4IXJ1_9BACT|nr:hypothetical protein [Gemmatimonas groenlandica]QJR37622.1 hypothetical protein HKW67_19915 [Gemmatimonas groenlandica]
MLATVAVLLQISVMTGPKPCDPKTLPAGAPPDTVCTGIVSLNVGGVGSGGKRTGAARHRTVTDAHRTSAFRDPSAKSMLLGARAARLRQDSALVGYDVQSLQRFSLGVSFSERVRTRNVVTYENASRVRWQRERGIVVDVQGARMSSGMLPRSSIDDNEASISASVPYYPGRDELWVGTGVVSGEVDDREMVHPMAEGAEAYYVYESGESATIQAGAAVIRIRELRVRPREVAWNVVVGSLWFDEDRGTLVRAAFRFAAPFDFWLNLSSIDSLAATELSKSVPRVVRPVLPSVRGQMEAVTLEYALYGGRFWLPRARYAEGLVQVSMARLPYRLEESFRYNAVNGTDSLAGMPPIVVPTPLPLTVANQRARDSIQAVQRARRDSVSKGLIPVGRAADPACETSAFYTDIRFAADGLTPVLTRVPCDRRLLATSPALPPDQAPDTADLFGATARAELIAQVMSMQVQPLFAPQRPTLHAGSGLLRYNRIEGLSVGVELRQQLGAGYSSTLSGRLGVADLVPNTSLALQRTDLQHTWTIAGYRELTAVGEDAPLSAGSSLGALLFGRDEGYYYRRAGLAVGYATASIAASSRVQWRLFAERQQSAGTNATWSLGRPMIDSNITAYGARYAGVGVDAQRRFGGAGGGLELASGVQVEGAVTDADARTGYGRATVHLALARSLGAFAGAIQLSGGGSIGALPSQRRFYLGGTRTLSGLSFGTAGGDAFWLARAEVSRGVPLIRPVLFADLGWAGARNDWRRGYRPLSDVGIGLRALDGLVRVDVARALYPVSRTRLSLAIERRF